MFYACFPEPQSLANPTNYMAGERRSKITEKEGKETEMLVLQANKGSFLPFTGIDSGLVHAAIPNC